MADQSVKSFGCWSADAISDRGERVTHLYPDGNYYYHLSIYDFAAQFSQNCMVLDAGSGAGYGSARLADRGARFVWGIDYSAHAISFSRHHFPRPNLQFRAMSLDRIRAFPNHHFDLVFSSQALEHIHRVPVFLRSAWELIKPEGILLVAVPAIVRPEQWAENVANPYHVNIWSPRQWHSVICQYFGDIECYRHLLQKPGTTVHGQPPERTVINEHDFTFEPISLDELCVSETLTAVFVARRPLAASRLPAADRPVLFVDESFTRYEPPWMIRARQKCDILRRSGLAEFLRSLEFLLPLRRIRVAFRDEGVRAGFRALRRELRGGAGSF